jgi:hypothetical protein
MNYFIKKLKNKLFDTYFINIINKTIYHVGN